MIALPGATCAQTSCAVLTISLRENQNKSQCNSNRSKTCRSVHLSRGVSQPLCTGGEPVAPSQCLQFDNLEPQRAIIRIVLVGFAAQHGLYRRGACLTTEQAALRRQGG